MINPWKYCDLEVYESHMNLECVGQLQLLNEIMESQFFEYSVDTVAIWGIAGGNGLNHISIDDFSRVYCIDINQDYLTQVEKRYSKLTKILFLECIDLNDLSVNLKEVDLVIANLIVEYVGINNFMVQIKKSNPTYISLVLQKDESDDFVSNSPYKKQMSKIGDFAVNIKKEDLIESLESIGFTVSLIKEYNLPNFKKFIRLDFKNSNF